MVRGTRSAYFPVLSEPGASDVPRLVYAPMSSSPPFADGRRGGARALRRSLPASRGSSRSRRASSTAGAVSGARGPCSDGRAGGGWVTAQNCPSGTCRRPLGRDQLASSTNQKPVSDTGSKALATRNGDTGCEAFPGTPEMTSGNSVTIPCGQCSRMSEAPAGDRRWDCPHCGRKARHYLCPVCHSVFQLTPREVNWQPCPGCGFKTGMRAFKRATTSDLSVELQREGLISDDPEAVRLRACVMLGGYGHDIAPNTRCGVLFASDWVRVTPAGKWPEGGGEHRRPLELAYQEITSIEVTGPGYVRSGSRVLGGGIGLEGAALGMAATSLVNSATSRQRIETQLSIAATELQVVLRYTHQTPEALRIALSRPIAQVEAAARHGTTSGEPGDITSQLGRLRDLHSQGALTDDEYTAAKSRLIERM